MDAKTITSIGLDPSRRYSPATIEDAYRMAWKASRKGEPSGQADVNGGSAERQKLQRIAREEAIVPAVLDHIRQHPGVPIKQRASMLDISVHYVRSVMAMLEHQGVIKRRGTSVATTWHVTERAQ